MRYVLLEPAPNFNSKAHIVVYLDIQIMNF
jgi:hypothetical protein